MFFFFPFAAEPATAAAHPRVTEHRALPLLPGPQSARAQVQPGIAFSSAVPEAIGFAVDLLKRALSLIASSLTALGNRANALFAQVAAALAFERMAREAAPFFAMFWPGLAQQARQMSFADARIAPALESWFLAPFNRPGFQANPLPFNPWAMFAETLNAWSSVWLPAAAPLRRSHPSTSVTTTFSLPGCGWSFTLG